MKHTGFFKRDVSYSHLNRCLKYALSGDVVVIKARQTNNFIQFKKYITPDGDYGLDISIPIVGVNSDKKDRVIALCKRHKLHYQEVATKHGWSFLFIDIGNDREKFQKILPDFFDLLGLPIEEVLMLGDDSVHLKEEYGLVLGNQPENVDYIERYRVDE